MRWQCFLDNCFWETLFEVAVWAHICRSAPKLYVSTDFIDVWNFSETIFWQSRLMKWKAGVINSSRSLISR